MNSSGGLPTVAIIGDSFTKHLPNSLPEEFIFHRSAPECKLENYLQILDNVPPSVKIFIFVIGSQSVAGVGIHACIEQVHLLLGHLRSSRPGAVAVFLSIPPRLPDLYQRYFDPQALGEINVRVRALNHHLWYLSIINKDVGFVAHREMEWWPEELLASDGLHPSRFGVRRMSETLRHVIHFRLGVLATGELPQLLGATPMERHVMAQTRVKTFASVAASLPASAGTLAPGPTTGTSRVPPSPVVPTHHNGGPNSDTNARYSTTTENLALYRMSAMNASSPSLLGAYTVQPVVGDQARLGLTRPGSTDRPPVPPKPCVSAGLPPQRKATPTDRPPVPPKLTASPNSPHQFTTVSSDQPPVPSEPDVAPDTLLQSNTTPTDLPPVPPKPSTSRDPPPQRDSPRRSHRIRQNKSHKFAR